MNNLIGMIMSTQNATIDKYARAECIREAAVIANKIRPEKAGQVITVSLRRFLPTTVKTIGFRAVRWRNLNSEYLVWVAERVF